MRTIKELLQLMLENKPIYINGLCTWIYYLQGNKKLTSQEYYLLFWYMRENKATDGRENKGYWWDFNQEGW